MHIRVIAVGKLRDKYIAELINKYAKRLPRGATMEWVEVAAEQGGKDVKQALMKEAARIRAQIPERAHVSSLSERGREQNSVEFARLLGRIRDEGRDACFIIGSADGLDSTLLKSADQVLSLSRLTFPHELVRAILAEQIYRAFSILAGHPYHRE
ncbi:MAG TPA: 23S rRNA (pseudouridine(1915)-N(3))-methyltransferase RlmH [bacterium]|nr:23S rRNA (pseudouridine(1915)-N(3))-methyltransferase RlmH [bacterium]